MRLAAARHTARMADRPAAEPPARLLVACLCAAWCGACRDYAPVFEAQAAQHDADYAWLDVEDHEEALDGLDIEAFPTLLIARGDALLFLGPLTPQPGTLARIVRSAAAGALPPIAAPVADLPRRLRRIAGVG